MRGFVYSLHATDGDHLGFLEHSAPNVEPGDVVLFTDGREALVTARVETGGPLAALLEVAVVSADRDGVERSHPTADPE